MHPLYDAATNRLLTYSFRLIVMGKTQRTEVVFYEYDGTEVDPKKSTGPPRSFMMDGIVAMHQFGFTERCFCGFYSSAHLGYSEYTSGLLDYLVE
jgi:hypothetical protein